MTPAAQPGPVDPNAAASTASPVRDHDEGSALAQSGRFIIRRHTDLRLDVYLQRRLQGISRSRVQKLIDIGAVKVNGANAKASAAVHRGDQVEITLPDQAVREIQAQPVPLDVLYEDESFIVINKQAGLIVHPARSHLSGTLLNGLAYYFRQQQAARGRAMRPRRTRGLRKNDIAGDPAFSPNETKGHRDTLRGLDHLSQVGAAEFRPGIVHRLDKNTTGVLVVAKADGAHWSIARQFADRSTIKAYLAVVHGNFDTVGGVLEYPIGKHPTIREAYAVRYDSQAKHAVTLYRVREQYKGYSLVELELKTGRTHQIRVHLSYVGHPIVGDILYGGEPIGQAELDQPPVAAGSRVMLTFARDKLEGQKVEAQAQARQDMILTYPALHAAMLSFIHPETENRVTFTAPLHAPMDRLIHALRPGRIQAPVAADGYWVDIDPLFVSESANDTRRPR